VRITIDSDDESQVHALVTQIRRQAHPPIHCPHATDRECQVDSMREALLAFGRTEVGLLGLSREEIQRGRV
jgi:hypothetical protein